MQYISRAAPAERSAQQKPLQQQVHSSGTHGQAIGARTQTIIGKNALAATKRRTRRLTISSGLLIRKRPQPKRVPSMKNARFAATRRRQLRFRLPAPQQNRPILRKPTRAPAQKARKPATTTILCCGSHCSLSAAALARRLP